jgi:hypothetical protein
MCLATATFFELLIITEIFKITAELFKVLEAAFACSKMILSEPIPSK